MICEYVTNITRVTHIILCNMIRNVLPTQKKSHNDVGIFYDDVKYNTQPGRERFIIKIRSFDCAQKCPIFNNNYFFI